jgi:homoserine dehydrogenase
VGDLIDVCHNLRQGGGFSGRQLFDQQIEMLPIEKLVSRYYLRMFLNDKPGVLAKIAGIFGAAQVSLSGMQMKVEDAARNIGEIVFLTHPCLEADFRRALAGLQETDAVRSIESWLRVEDAV